MEKKYLYVEDVAVAKEMGLIPANSRKKSVHFHTYGGELLTGTSSPSDIIAKPLTWWASGLAVKCFGITDPKLLTKIKNKKVSEAEQPLVDELMASVAKKLEEIRNMSDEEFFTLVDSAYRAHDKDLDKTSEAGNDLHAELSRFVKDEMHGRAFPLSAYNERIYPFIAWARGENGVKEYYWSEIHCYSHPDKHGLGGISDVGALLKNGKKVIIDFKSSKEAYLTQFWQCAGYDIQIEENGGFTPDGENIFAPGFKADEYIVVPFGMEVIEPQFYSNPEKARECFLHEVFLYRELPRD